MSPAFQRARLKVEPADRALLVEVVDAAGEVAAAREAADWEAVVSLLRSLAAENGEIDDEPIGVIDEDTTAFLEQAGAVSEVASAGTASAPAP